jgi:hypothetical protein
MNEPAEITTISGQLRQSLNFSPGFHAAIAAGAGLRAGCPDTAAPRSGADCDATGLATARIPATVITRSELIMSSLSYCVSTAVFT